MRLTEALGNLYLSSFLNNSSRDFKIRAKFDQKKKEQSNKVVDQNTNSENSSWISVNTGGISERWEAESGFFTNVRARLGKKC